MLLDYQPKKYIKTKKPDNSLWSKWLKKNVSAKGVVKYKKGKKKEKLVKKYLKKLLSIDHDRLKNPEERLAFFINLYNAIVVYGVLKNYPINSVNDVRNPSFFNQKFYLKGIKTSIDDLEKKIILKRFKEPLVHFALNCASYSCPPLRNKPYRGKNLKTILTKQTKLYLNNSEFVRIDRDKKEFRVIELFKWYKSDLGYPKKFYTKYSGKYYNLSNFKIVYIKYNWELNNK